MDPLQPLVGLLQASVPLIRRGSGTARLFINARTRPRKWRQRKRDQAGQSGQIFLLLLLGGTSRLIAAIHLLQQVLHRALKVRATVQLDPLSKVEG